LKTENKLSLKDDVKHASGYQERKKGIFKEENDAHRDSFSELSIDSNDP
jgi:hypothetical protein